MGRKSRAARLANAIENNEETDTLVQKKSILRACVSTNPQNDAVSNVVVEKKVKRVKKIKKKKKTGNEIDSVDGEKGEGKINGVSGEEKVLTDEVVEITKEAVGANAEQTPDNAVLRKLLRGPRYFDPPENSWGACYNCGEEGHSTVNCTSARRKKPCFVCGGFEHNAKQCTKGRDCFICKQQGHRAKDCPEKNSSKICLKCRDDGHDMFSCRNEYCPDDLKEIKCYVCHRVGHLCCVDYGSLSKIQVSCYRCGGSGHSGLACTRSHHSHGETNGTGTPNSCYKCGVGGHFARECTNSAKGGGDTNGSCYKCGDEGHFARECTNSKKANNFERPSFDLDPYTNGSCYNCGGEGHFARECTTSSKKVNHFEGPSYDLDQYTDGSCYKCGEEGHFARQCTSSNKAGKRNREHSTPKQRSSKKTREYSKVRSAPHNFGKAHAYNSYHEEFSSPVQSKHRGGWNPEDPVPEYYNSVPRGNNWRSPATPRDRLYEKYSTGGDYYAPNHDSYSSRNPHVDNFASHSSRKPHDVHFRHAASQGLASYYEQRYHHPPARYGSSSHGGKRRDYDRW